ncbi:AN1-type zinc finger protein 1 isoform X3 [Hypanus sabinus]|uniref:AN1-type zinc finger protein 1 isoform X3 n=1 Tax=Hypanus sabinus TaxID=79690 RepID=UPI0028C40A71|nr:AN1-type zinc finger protein 1 isoform X3 [Hypanus sabinus]
MAELEIGKQCTIQHCRQLDFLPFVCDACSGTYCLEHRNKDAHGCSGVLIRKEPVQSKGSSSYSCSFKSCKTNELVPIICPECDKHFCLKHRHQSDHDCEKQQVSKSHLVVIQQSKEEALANQPNPVKKGRTGAKNDATAAKVALMKLKLHAVGDKSIPQVSRCRGRSSVTSPLAKPFFRGVPATQAREDAHELPPAFAIKRCHWISFLLVRLKWCSPDSSFILTHGVSDVNQVGMMQSLNQTTLVVP